MSFDRAALAAALGRQSRVARVVVAATQGSVPREAGAAMLVWSEGQEGTIGGGALEWQAAARARALLDRKDGPDAALDRVPLGPGVGQCCGGAVSLLTEVWTAERLARLDGPVVARPAGAGPATDVPPLSVQRLLAAARGQGHAPAPALVDGWMVEPVGAPARPLWVWGAGHVGRAIVSTVAPLPDFAVTWLDTSPGRFPPDPPPNVAVLPSPDLPAAVRLAPLQAEHLILTYSHALDLDLCHALLGHGFAACGLIGSKTKWARFRSRLRQLGHPEPQIARIVCPIGNPTLGKHPQAIAIGVVADLLRSRPAAGAEMTA